jgi:hypothetical protein
MRLCHLIFAPSATVAIAFEEVDPPDSDVFHAIASARFFNSLLSCVTAR